MVPRDNEDDFEDDEFNEEASAPPLPPEYDFRGQGGFTDRFEKEGCF